MAHTNRLIAGVDLRSQENNRAHRTEEIDRKRLIVRRGQAFSLTVHLFHPLQSGHELALVLKQDAVYFPDERLLKEYIMNENGRIFTGSADWMSGLPWNFEQFEDNVMDICFEILDRFKPARSDPPNDMFQRWDPVYISRAVVAMTQMGVLVWWGFPFTQTGTPPSYSLSPFSLNCIKMSKCTTPKPCK
ncbi:unnamed protein product [Arctogadus glacialis]